jgi:hypothetical protein
MSYKLKVIMLTAGVSCIDLEPPDGLHNWHIESIFPFEYARATSESTNLTSTWDAAQSKTVSIPNIYTSGSSSHYLGVLWKSYDPKNQGDNLSDSTEHPEKTSW